MGVDNTSFGISIVNYKKLLLFQGQFSYSKGISVEKQI